MVLTVLVAGSRAAPQPQFGGLKKLISSFSGDEEAGEGNDGDYQSVPYETIQTFDVSPKTFKLLDNSGDGGGRASWHRV